MIFTCWTQTADFKQTDHGEITCEQALTMMQAFDWDGEAERFNQLIDEQKQACPPGIGINDSDGSILHIYLGPEGTFTLHVGLIRVIRLLWILPFRYTRRFETNGHNQQDAIHAIEDFFHPASEEE